MTEVERTALVTRFDAAIERRLTLVVAPAGWGKTTAVRQWASRQAQELVWVSAVGDGCCGSSVDALHDLGFERGVVVVDDADRLAPELRAQLLAKIESEGNPTHFVVVARSDEPFVGVAARLTVRNLAVRVGRRDLAFAIDEAREAYGSPAGEVTKHADTIEAVWTATAGWPAAMGAARQADGTLLVSGARAYVRDHVLSELPPPLREFVLCTSVVDAFNDDLASVLVGFDNTQGLLQQARAHDLVDDADGRPTTCCYPMLIRDAARETLRSRSDETERALLVRAAAWHAGWAAVDDIETAGCYLLRAQAWEELGALVMTHARAMQVNGRAAKVRAWLERMPHSVIARDPELVLVQAALLTLAGDTLGSEAALRPLGDRADLAPRYRGHAEMIRSTWELGHLPPDAALDSANKALAIYDEQPPGDFFALGGIVTAASARTVAVLGRARALWLAGDVAAGASELRAEVECGDTLPLSRLNVSAMVAMMEAWHGRPSVALRYAGLAGRIAREGIVPDHPFVTVADLALAHVLVEQGNTRRAATVLDRSERRIGDIYALFQTILVIERSWLAFVERAPREALSLLDAHLPNAHRAPYIQGRIAALAARALVALGDVEGARRRIDELGTAVETADISAVAVEVALADGDMRGARRALAGWPDRTELQPQLGFEIHCAATEYFDGDPTAAARRLDALTAEAEVEHFNRLFLDAGRHVRALLVDAARRSPSGFYGRLLESTPRREVSYSATTESLLTPREQLVLKHLAARATHAEIADALGVSLHTVKTHTSNLYAKLGATGRQEAVARAVDEGIL